MARSSLQIDSGFAATRGTFFATPLGVTKFSFSLSSSVPDPFALPSNRLIMSIDSGFRQAYIFFGAMGWPNWGPRAY